MSKLLRNLLVVTVMNLLIWNSDTVAHSELISTGIGFRGSFYNPSAQPSGVRFSRHLGYAINSAVKAGGCLYVFSRIGESTLLEFSIGTIASIEQEVSFIASQKVDVFNLTPILVGIRYDFLQNQNRSILQPYLSGGLGAYVLSDVNLVQKIWYEEVEVSTSVKPGLFVGGGINIQIGSWTALNFDGKYHFVNINPNFEYSGFEFGIGFNFSWGSYNH